MKKKKKTEQAHVYSYAQACTYPLFFGLDSPAPRSPRTHSICNPQARRRKTCHPVGIKNLRTVADLLLPPGTALCLTISGLPTGTGIRQTALNSQIAGLPCGITNALAKTALAGTSVNDTACRSHPLRLYMRENGSFGRCWRVGGSPVGGFPPCGVSPRGVWGLPPLRFLCRALLLAFMSCVPDASGVPVPGRPPGYKHGFGTPAAAERCSKQNVQGLPHLRSGSEYENNLHAAWANRVMELINSRASAAAAAAANFEQPAPAQQSPPLQSAVLPPTPHIAHFTS